MLTGLHVGLSAQIALQKRLETLSHNVANMNTTGFRSDEVRFESVLANAGDKSIAYSSTGDTFLSRISGAIVKTDNPLDVAVAGEGWLGISTASGTAYTKDGRMTMRESGALVSVNGNPVLDNGGSGISLDPNGGPASISRDGAILQSGRQIATLGLFQLDPAAKLVRGENASVIPDKPATPVANFIQNGIVQGSIENANVNPVSEMTRLITVQRNFEQITSALETSETSLNEAIKTLGGG